MAEQKAKVVKVGRGGPRGPRPKVQNPGKIFMRILRYVMECYRIQVVAVVICIFVSVFANVQGTLFMQTLIDGYILPLLKEQSSDFSGLAHAIARTAGFYGIGIVAAFAQARMMAYVTQGTLKCLRDEMFTHMQTLPIKYFDRNAHGDIMSLYTNDIDTLRAGFHGCTQRAADGAHPGHGRDYAAGHQVSYHQLFQVLCFPAA